VRTGVHKFAFDTITKLDDDAIIFGNHDSSSSDEYENNRLMSFHKTLKPRIVIRIRCRTLAFGIRLIQRGLIRRQLRHISRSLDSQVFKYVHRKQPTDIMCSCFWKIRFRMVSFLTQTDMPIRQMTRTAHWLLGAL